MLPRLQVSLHPVTGNTSNSKHSLPAFSSRKTYCTVSPREHKPHAKSSHRDRIASPSYRQSAHVVSNSPVTHTLPRSVHLSSITPSSNCRRVISTGQSPPAVHAYDALLLRFIAAILSMSHLGLYCYGACTLMPSQVTWCPIRPTCTPPCYLVPGVTSQTYPDRQRVQCGNQLSLKLKPPLLAASRIFYQ